MTRSHTFANDPNRYNATISALELGNRWDSRLDGFGVTVNPADYYSWPWGTWTQLPGTAWDMIPNMRHETNMGHDSSKRFQMVQSLYP